MKAIVTVLMLASFGLFACTTEIPHPTAHEQSTQPKLLAAQHWNLLAADVAKRLADGLKDAGGNPTVLHVQKAAAPTVFNLAFHDLLVTQLMQQGFGIAISPSADSLNVAYDIQYAGVADLSVDTGLTEVEPPDNDIIINISVVSGNRYVTRMSEIFYIDALTKGEYFSGSSGAPTRLVEVTGP